MITIFTLPKPFQGHINIIQRNAIQSWTKIAGCEVLLMGDDAGVAEAAKDYKVRHIPDIDKNEFGTPLLDSAFKKAEQEAKHDILCYVNADIILLNDLVETVKRVSFSKYLVVGQRRNIDIQSAWNFNSKNWEADLRQKIEQEGQLHPPVGIDYFVYPKGAIRNLPSFAVGRPGWDLWMIFNARSSGFATIDATQTVLAIHQNHDYSHIKNKADVHYKGPESEKNFELVGGALRWFTIEDANYVITKESLSKKKWTLKMLRRYIFIYLPAFYPPIRSIFSFIAKAYKRIRGKK